MSGPISTTKTRNDFRIIQIWFTTAKYLAFTPFNIQSRPKNHRKCLTSKIYPLVLLLLYLGATIFSFYERSYHIYKTFNFSQVILDVLQGVVEGVFIELVVLWSVVKRNKWKRLIKSITQLEQKINLTFEGGIRDSNLRVLQLKILLYHLVYVAAHIYDSIANWTDVSYSLAFVIFRFTTYYIMFSTIFITFLCTWLKHKYLYLEHLLKESVGGKKFKLVFLDKEPRCVSYDKFKEFSQNYKELFLIVQDINELLGCQMFFISIGTVLEILNAVNYGIPIYTVTMINDNTFVNSLYSTLYATCNTRIVMACDSVEKCGIKIRTTCLILHESSEKCEAREELFKLANYVQGLCPKFSAAGFWQVNQHVLSTLFSSVMTYLIIIIQFNITLK